MADSPDRSQREDDAMSVDIWLVVAALVVAFLVIPWSLIALPSAQGIVGAVGFSMRDAYLVVPLVPAIGLGLLGVWTAVRSRRSR